MVLMSRELTLDIFRDMLNGPNGKTISTFMFHRNRASDLIMNCMSEIQPTLRRSEIVSGTIGTIFKERIKLQYNNYLRDGIIIAVNKKGSRVTSYNLGEKKKMKKITRE